MAKSKFSAEVLDAFKYNPHFTSVWVLTKDGKTWWTSKQPGTTEVTRRQATADLAAIQAEESAEAAAEIAAKAGKKDKGE